MKLSRNDFDWAVSNEIITAQQSCALWKAFTERTAGTAKFDFVHLAYYAGAVLVILAMGLFLALNSEGIGAMGTFAVAAIYGAFFWVGALVLRDRDDMKVLSGLLASLAVCTVPVMVYSLQNAMHLWPERDSEVFTICYRYNAISWMVVNAFTVAAGLLALQYIRFPFMAAPILVATYNLAVDATSCIYGTELRALVTILFGTMTLIVAYEIDLRRIQHRDFAFWFYLFGSLALFCGLEQTFPYPHSGFAEFGCFIIFVGMIVLSVLLQRRTIMVFGALGIVIEIIRLSWDVFRDSNLFPIVLIILGLACLASGIVIQKHRKQLRDTIFSIIPPNMHEYLPQR